MARRGKMRRATGRRERERTGEDERSVDHGVVANTGRSTLELGQSRQRKSSQPKEGFRGTLWDNGGWAAYPDGRRRTEERRGQRGGGALRRTAAAHWESRSYRQVWATFYHCGVLGDREHDSRLSCTSPLPHPCRCVKVVDAGKEHQPYSPLGCYKCQWRRTAAGTNPSYLVTAVFGGGNLMTGLDS